MVTTDPAPTIEPSPNVIPGKTVQLTPKVEYLLKITGLLKTVLCSIGTTGEIKPCIKSSVAHTILLPEPIFVKSSITINAGAPPIIETLGAM